MALVEHGTLHTFGTHFCPHPDEAVAFWLLHKFGAHRFAADVTRLKLLFTDAGPRTPDLRPASDWEKEGVLWVGCGGGRLDEHSDPSLGISRKEGECAATLMAADLGVSDDPRLSLILEYTKKIDLMGGPQPFDIFGVMNAWNEVLGNGHSFGWFAIALDVLYAITPSILKLQEWARGAEVAEAEAAREHLGYTSSQQDYYRRVASLARYFDVSFIATHMPAIVAANLISEDEEITSLWMRAAIDVMQRRQIMFSDALQEVKAASHLTIGHTHVAVVSSDNRRASAAIRHCFPQVDIVIQGKSTGHVAIFCNKKKGAHLGDIPRVIRAAELLKNGVKDCRLVPDYLDADGTLDEVPAWHHMKDGRMLLNGSASAPNKRATRLSLEEIVSLVTIALEGGFEPSHAANCEKGVCAREKCPWYPYLLTRCVDLRYRALLERVTAHITHITSTRQQVF